MLPFNTQTQFPLTCADSYCDVRSKDVDKVQARVDLGISPYKAWLNVLGIPTQKLSEHLGITPKAAQYYLSTNNASPHCANVRKMCDSLGIHPAYLQPALRFESYEVMYHPSVLEAICEVLKDPNAPLEDRVMSMHALHSEKDKFEKFLKEHPERATFLIEAMEYAVLQNPKVPCPDTLKWNFNNASQWPINDVERSLALYEIHLQEEFRPALQKYLDAMKDTAWSHNKIVNTLATQLYGAEFSEQCLSLLSNKILDMNSLDEKAHETFWAYFKPSILKSFDMHGSAWDLLDAPTLQPDFEAKMMREGDDPRKVKAKFWKALPDYIEQKRSYRNTLEDYEEKYRQSLKFANWMESEETHLLDIPLYKNYCVATHHLDNFNREPGVEYGTVIAKHWRF